MQVVAGYRSCISKKKKKPWFWKAKPSIQMLCALTKSLWKRWLQELQPGEAGRGCSTMWREIKTWELDLLIYFHIFGKNTSWMNNWLPAILSFRPLDKMTVHSLFLEQVYIWSFTSLLIIKKVSLKNRSECHSVQL